MKTKITILTVILTFIALTAFFSCDNPVSLGTRLDLDGPEVNITSPEPRTSVPDVFNIEGTISDYSGVKKFLMKAVYYNENLLQQVDFARQWRYQNGAWEISDDYGSAWQPFANAQWTADATNTYVEWKIPVDMKIGKSFVQDGEYTFSVQAWDNGDVSDENSLKARVFIVDLNPPKVDITYPYIYRGKNAYTAEPLKSLHEIKDGGDEKQNPSYLGKFITQQFNLQWQIDDINEVKSFDLRIYPFDADGIDENPDTELPDTYIYRYYKELPPASSSAQGDYIKLNGSVTVPALTSPAGSYNGGEIKNPIKDIDNSDPDLCEGKTTVKIVVTCYDMAGNSNYPKQEKTVGYFIYWPKANLPWITFTEGMEPVTKYSNGSTVGNNLGGSIDDDVFMVYPGRSIRATAFQAHGVKEVKYSVYICDTANNTLDMKDALNKIEKKKVKEGTVSNNAGTLIFPWNIDSPVITGYYILYATAYSSTGVKSEDYSMLFRVQDITFPVFIDSPSPKASDPLFKAVDSSGNITIKGQVDDATEITSLCLVWINPESPGYAAMSQLQYFRDDKYQGWIDAKTLAVGGTAEQFDTGLGGTEGTANRIWKVALTNKHQDPESNRWVYDYSQTINLKNEMKIDLTAKNGPYLKSQIFLLRAENPDSKCTIITYAPQGDTIAPEIEIETVVINHTDPNTHETSTGTYKPTDFGVIPKFANNDEIIINGNWKEDSALYLSLTNYFKPNFKLKVNSKDIPYSDISMSPSGLSNEGKWTVTVKVGGAHINVADLLDTLVISAEVSDVGGNKGETGVSWLIQSDTLRLMRISSELDDGTYTVGSIPTTHNSNGRMEIFLEFNKPVRLKNPTGNNLQLILSSSTGNTVRANYKSGQNTQNSRQYFEYTIESGETTAELDTTVTPNVLVYKSLNVKGIANNNTEITNASNEALDSYPFTWLSGAGDELEEIRLTRKTNSDGTSLMGTSLIGGSGSYKGYYLRTVPTTTTISNDDYKYTLGAGKSIKIDTTKPTVTSITSKTSAGYYRTGDIFMTVTFSKNVTVTGVPRLILSVTNGSTTAETSNDASDVKVTNNEIVFKYSIRNNDYTDGAAIVVNNYTGTIKDLAGNSLASDGISGFTGNKTLTGVIIETRQPATPTVRVLSANNINNIVSTELNPNTSSATTVEGISASGVKDLKNLYHDKLWLAINPAQTQNYRLDHLEYSINNGASWIKVVKDNGSTNNDNTPFSISQKGEYKLIAKQVDPAGNESPISTNINFTWDPGEFLERISSSSANGTYTNVGGRNTIDITLYFRKSLTFSTPTITLNVRRNGNDYILSGTPGTGTSCTFTYTVQNGDSIPNDAFLAIKDINLPYPMDSDKVNVSSFIDKTKQLDSNKQFTIATGSLTNTAPEFIANNQGGTGYNDKTSSNFHGIREDDGSYWTTLQITFTRPISKGDGNIIIQQVKGSGVGGAYRLPAVLTEAQYNRFKNISGISTYYEKGTNGYNNSTSSSDTSTKYILKYKYNPNTWTSFTAANQVSGDSFIPEAFFDAFREAEKVTVPVNSQAVTITDSTGKIAGETGVGILNTLRIRLSGSSAPQVPGATYSVTYGAGIVNDDLGNSSSVGNYTNVVLRGVAKPFIRIRKLQDTITSQTGDASSPRLVANLPMQAYVRMDCRTPGSAIYYTRNEDRTKVNTGTLNANSTNSNWSPTGNPSDMNTTVVNRPDAPSSTSNEYNTTSVVPSREIPLGAGETSDNQNSPQGYQWWARAYAITTAANDNSSLETEEIAYRTVITYQLRKTNGSITSASGEMVLNQTVSSTASTDGTNNRTNSYGDQVWIRGGDAIGSSSIPGFPLTWEDNWNNLSGKRAGIRLLRKTNTNDLNNNSIWRYVTWDINATAYVDFIMGRDCNDPPTGTPTYAASSNDVAWQYGPRRWAYQRAGWTSYKERYPIYPGKHRWCDTGYDNQGKGDINFSGTFMARPVLAVDYTNPNTNN